MESENWNWNRNWNLTTVSGIGIGIGIEGAGIVPSLFKTLHSGTEMCQNGTLAVHLQASRGQYLNFTTQGATFW